MLNFNIFTHIKVGNRSRNSKDAVITARGKSQVIISRFQNGLCAVVEQMYSFEQLFSYTGSPKWLERLEVLAFNALPATFSDDMWAHQYDQLSNQINCIAFPLLSHFISNSVDAHLFGLEPNYGCCTANLSQGFPKFTLSAFAHNGDTVTIMGARDNSLSDFAVSLCC